MKFNKYFTKTIIILFFLLNSLLSAQIQVSGFNIETPDKSLAYANTIPSITKYPDYSPSLPNYNPVLPYGLKKAKKRKKDTQWISEFKSLEYDKTFLVGKCKYKEAKKLFRGRKSGIVFEFIPISDYDKDSENFLKVPNRRNEEFELNGALSKPIYRRDLLKYSKENIPRDYFIYTRLLKIKKPPVSFVLPLPPNSSEKEYNIFLIKNKRLVSHRTYMMLPYGFFEMPFPELSFKIGFNQLDSTQSYQTSSELDTVIIKIDYPVASAEISSQGRENIIESLRPLQGDLVSLEGFAYASIDGDSIANKQLANERFYRFYELIKPSVKKELTTYVMHAEESWDLFYRQIKGTKLAHLSSWDKTRIRIYINHNKNDSLVKCLLDQQRYTSFQLVSKKDFKERIVINQTPVQRFDSLVNKIGKRSDLSKSECEDLEEAQLAYYHHIATKDSLLSQSLITIPFAAGHPEFRYHESLFKYLVLKNISDHELFDTWHEIGFSKYLPRRLKNDLLYNNNVLIYNNFFNVTSNSIVDQLSCYESRKKNFYFEDMDVKSCDQFYVKRDNYYVLSELAQFIKQQRKVNGDSLTHELWRFYYRNIIKTLYEEIPLNIEFKTHLKGFKKYFHPDDSKLTEEERLKFAYFYSSIKVFPPAKKIIEPLVYKDNPKAEALKLYIVLKYYDYGSNRIFNEFLMTMFVKLGKYEWCDIWHNPAYLNALLLEDLKLKEFYNCNCDR